MKLFYYICLLSVLVACATKPEEKVVEVAEEVIEVPQRDTIVVEEVVNEEEDSKFENIFEKHEYYLPFVDSIVALHRHFDSLNLWNTRDTFNTIDYFETTEGSELRVSILDSIARYEVFLLGETRRIEDAYYFFNDTLKLYVNTDIQYNRPIYYDSAMMLENNDDEVFDPNSFEIFVEDNIVENNKIIHQLSADCGAPNAQSYVERVEAKMFETLAIIKTVIQSDTLNH